VVKATEVEGAAIADAAWAQTMNAFVAGVASMATAGAGTTTYSGQAAVASGTGRPAGTMAVTGQSYNARQAAQAQRQVVQDAVANSEVIRAREQAQLGRVAALIQRHTLEPGEAVAGVLVIEPPRESACVVTSTVTRQVSAERQQGPPMEIEIRTSVPCKLRLQVRIGGDLHTVGFDEVFSPE
jgi:hypothetical protein